MSSSAMSTCSSSTNSDYGGVIEKIQELLRPEDRIIQTVRLEGGHTERQRFLSIVCNQNADEYCLLGIDCSLRAKQLGPNNLIEENDYQEDIEVNTINHITWIKSPTYGVVF